MSGKACFRLHPIRGHRVPLLVNSALVIPRRIVTAERLPQIACAAQTRRQALTAAIAATVVISNGGRSHAEAATCIDTQSCSTPAYDEFAETYDDLDDGWIADIFGIPTMRRRLLQNAAGSVLEVGVGTGINLPLYDRKIVSSVTGVDISRGMLSQASRRIESNGLSGWAYLQNADVTALPFEDAVFDTVVDTFSLCVFSQPARALAEMSRTVKPKGRLLLLEHSRSDVPPLGWWQDASASTVAAGGKGCYWNQDITSLVQQAGLRVLKQQVFLAGLVRIVVAEKNCVKL